jgi:glycosyltransferase involved in cell wall biosynthesis
VIHQPFVSIIINNYNYERFLSQAIDSALDQTYSNREVIVVDDGSTDGSRKIIASYSDRIISILKTNGGQASAFNAGFAASRGDIILFLDSDDYLFPNTLQRVVEVWRPHLSKVHYRLEAVDGERNALGYSYPQGGSLACGDVHYSLLAGQGYSTNPTSGNALSRIALSQVLPMPELEFRLAADNYLTTLIPFYGSIQAIEEPLGAYRIHGSNGWVAAAPNVDKFYKFVQHDLQRDTLIAQKAKELGYDLPHDLELRFFGRYWSRLASLRMNPQKHPIASDHPLSLAYSGIYSLWKYSDFNWQKRFIFSLWFLWVGLMPLPLAKPAITWLFTPQSRPQLIGWTLTQLRSLVS